MPGRAVSWLSGRGHLNAEVQRAAPAHVTAALALLHRQLGGDTNALAIKRAAVPPVPDFVHTGLGCLVEIDEQQHFTTARMASFEVYPDDVPLGFDRAEYLALIGQWKARGDKAFAHKTASDFPSRGGRQAHPAEGPTGAELDEAPYGRGTEIDQTYGYDLDVHCGVEWARIDGAWWQTAPLGDGNANPPPGWGNPPFHAGELVLLDDTSATFTGPEGPIAFERTDRSDSPNGECG